MTTTTRPADRSTADPLQASPEPRAVRLRPAVHVSSVPDGLLVVGWQSRVLVSGGTALHRLWAAIGPHLNNGVDPAVLLAALPEAARPTVQQLVDRLADSGMLVPVRGTLVAGEGTSGASSPTIHRLLEFLDSAADSPQDAWHTLRTATVVVTGSGTVAERAVELLRDHGIGRVVDPDQPSAESADLVLLTDDTPLPESITATDAPAVHVLSLGDRAIVLPAARDHRPQQVRQQLANRGNSHATAAVPVTVALLAAGQAVVQVIYALTGIVTEFDRKLISIQADRLRISHHPLWPDTGVDTQPVALDARVPHDPEILADLTDPLTGLLPEALPGAWPQNPFAVAVTGDESVLGMGVTGAAARYRAALESARNLLQAEQARVPRDAVVAAGADVDQFVVDALTRLIARGIASDLVRPTSGPDLEDPDPAVSAARHRLSTVVGACELTIGHFRLSRDPDLLAIAVLRDPAGTTVAVALGHDPAEALVRAADHTTARAQCGGRGGSVAQLGLAMDLEQEDRPWSGQLDRLARAVTGTPVGNLTLNRVGDGHPLGGLGILGWLWVPEVIS